ncbi:hypothetical protein BC826DRAFT_967222 [Russula brevipes]|nr:hypothetical protein BC826DRAFT_967222 [Russula brevipes]
MTPWIPPGPKASKSAKTAHKKTVLIGQTPGTPSHVRKRASAMDPPAVTEVTDGLVSETSKVGRFPNRILEKTPRYRRDDNVPCVSTTDNRALAGNANAPIPPIRVREDHFSGFLGHRHACARRWVEWLPGIDWAAVAACVTGGSFSGSELTMRELVVLPAEPHCKIQYNTPPVLEGVGITIGFISPTPGHLMIGRVACPFT